MSPFMAIGEAFTTFKDQITSVGEVFAFGFKGLGKGFKKLISGIKFLGKFFMTGKVLIGVAIAGLVIGLIKFKDKLKGVKDFLMGIPKTIGDFFKEQFVKIKNVLIDVINGMITVVNKVLPKSREIGLIKKEVIKETTEEEQKAADKFLQEKQEAENEIVGPSENESAMISDLQGSSEVKIKSADQTGDVLGSLNYKQFDLQNLGKSQEERLQDANAITENTATANGSTFTNQNNSSQTNISGTSSTTVGVSSGTANVDKSFNDVASSVSP
jgi:hypothetical protein